MKALILCAGLGTRLKPLTDTMPKCMVDINGKPVLKRLVDYLHSFDIYDIVVNLHSFPEQVMEYFGNELLYYYEPEPLGEAQTEEFLRPWLGDKYVVMNGDTLTDLWLPKMIIVGDYDKRTVISTENGVYTGIKYVTRGSKPEEDYFHSWWQDMGTPEGLELARKHYL
jgi:NDP-sugar pyrophosphorylase family protein